MVNRCGGCGANLDLVGRTHRCTAAVQSKQTVAVKNEPRTKREHVSPVVDKPRFDRVTYQREYMRKRRNEQRTKAEQTMPKP